jgi:hypothetical protein
MRDTKYDLGFRSKFSGSGLNPPVNKRDLSTGETGEFRPYDAEFLAVNAPEVQRSISTAENAGTPKAFGMFHIEDPFWDSAMLSAKPGSESAGEGVAPQSGHVSNFCSLNRGPLEPLQLLSGQWPTHTTCRLVQTGCPPWTYQGRTLPVRVDSQPFVSTSYVTGR